MQLGENRELRKSELIRRLSTNPARVLGLEGGSLAVGSVADFALIDAPDLNHWLYHFRDNACLGVVKTGRWVHGNGGTQR